MTSTTGKYAFLIHAEFLEIVNLETGRPYVFKYQDIYEIIFSHDDETVLIGHCTLRNMDFTWLEITTGKIIFQGQRPRGADFYVGTYLIYTSASNYVRLIDRGGKYHALDLPHPKDKLKFSRDTEIVSNGRHVYQLYIDNFRKLQWTWLGEFPLHQGIRHDNEVISVSPELINLDGGYLLI
jgi:hypothetical protein